MNDPVKSRFLAREKALQAIYASFMGGHQWDEGLEMALEDSRVHPDTAAFARRLAAEAYDQSEVWERAIAKHLAKGWSLDRLAIMDRLCLTLAAAELHTESGIPPKATLTQWVKLASRYGHKDSSRFVHGVLAKIWIESPKADWDPSMEERWDEGDFYEPDEEVTTLEVSPEDPDLQEAVKAGAWVVRQTDSDKDMA
jgi:transcription antitermination protein NusB